MPYRLINEKGLFAAADFKGVITQTGWTHLQQARPQMAANDAAAFDAAAPFVAQLATHKAFFVFGPNDGAPPPVAGTAHAQSHHFPHGTGIVPALGWFSPGTFQGSSRNLGTLLPSDDPDLLGWVGIQGLAHPKIMDPWCALLHKHGLGVGMGDAFKGGRNTLARAQAWRFAPDDPTALLREGASCALFSVASNGYLNDKGSFGPLAGCRLFESAAAARRTAGSRNLENCVVVEVFAQVRGLAPDEPAPEDLGQLRGVLAHIDADRLARAVPIPEDTPAPQGRRPRI